MSHIISDWLVYSGFEGQIIDFTPPHDVLICMKHVSLQL